MRDPKNGKEHSAEDVETLQRIAALAIFSLESASRILESMFGTNHKYIASVAKKLRKAKGLPSMISAGGNEVPEAVEQPAKRARKRSNLD